MWWTSHIIWTAGQTKPTQWPSRPLLLHCFFASAYMPNQLCCAIFAPLNMKGNRVELHGVWLAESFSPSKFWNGAFYTLHPHIALQQTIGRPRVSCYSSSVFIWEWLMSLCPRKRCPERGVLQPCIPLTNGKTAIELSGELDTQQQTIGSGVLWASYLSCLFLSSVVFGSELGDLLWASALKLSCPSQVQLSSSCSLLCRESQGCKMQITAQCLVNCTYFSVLDFVGGPWKFLI